MYGSLWLLIICSSLFHCWKCWYCGSAVWSTSFHFYLCYENESVLETVSKQRLFKGLLNKLCFAQGKGVVLHNHDNTNVDYEVVEQIQGMRGMWYLYFDYGALWNIPFYQNNGNIGTQAYCCKDFVISGMVKYSINKSWGHVWLLY